MADHDPLCRDYGRVFQRVTVDSAPFPCDCDLIARVIERERSSKDVPWFCTACGRAALCTDCARSDREAATP